MSRRQADRFRALSEQDLTRIRLNARLTMLRREWADPRERRVPAVSRPLERNPRRYDAILWKKQNGRCAYCCKSLDGVKTHVDHIVPRSLNGLNTLTNYALTCVWCNITKKNKSALTFALQLLSRYYS